MAKPLGNVSQFNTCESKFAQEVQHPCLISEWGSLKKKKKKEEASKMHFLGPNPIRKLRVFLNHYKTFR